MEIQVTTDRKLDNTARRAISDAIFWALHKLDHVPESIGIRFKTDPELRQ